jgi:hypothetical protein
MLDTILFCPFNDKCCGIIGYQETDLCGQLARMDCIEYSLEIGSPPRCKYTNSENLYGAPPFII